MSGYLALVKVFQPHVVGIFISASLCHCIFESGSFSIGA